MNIMLYIFIYLILNTFGLHNHQGLNSIRHQTFLLTTLLQNIQ